MTPATQSGSPGEPLLSVESLGVEFVRSGRPAITVISDASLEVEQNTAVGLVGESGSGKTMLCRTLVGTLRRHGARIAAGRILFRGEEIAHAPESAWRRLRGRSIGYIPQSSLAGLNPVLDVGTQLRQSIAAATGVRGRSADMKALELLDRVHMPRARTVLRQYAPELSGGMRQRVMIAAAIAQEPRLLIADEPTTALDVTVQAQILGLLVELREELGMALVFVSHDLSVIADVCDRVAVMYAGSIVEVSPLQQLGTDPRHPYTRALLASRVDDAIPGRDLLVIPGEPPALGQWPVGCRFAPRCPIAQADCQVGKQPNLAEVSSGHLSACLYAKDLAELDTRA